MASTGPQSVDASGLASGLPTAVGDGWYLVGHMTNAGGMFEATLTSPAPTHTVLIPTILTALRTFIARSRQI